MMLRSCSCCGDASLYSDMGGYGFYFITVLDFSYIVLLCAWSLDIMITELKLISNRDLPSNTSGLVLLGTRVGHYKCWFLGATFMVKQC